jgi:cholesterol oxidase
VTSIEPTYWGIGSDIFAFLVTYHQHGEQKHPTASWLKELFEHPAEVLGFDDPRHWSERSFIALCMQTTDTSIELYWHDGLLRSRPSGAPPLRLDGSTNAPQSPHQAPDQGIRGRDAGARHACLDTTP